MGNLQMEIRRAVVVAAVLLAASELGEEVVKKDKNFYHAAADACACCAAAQIKKGKPISAESSCFTVSTTKPLASHGKDAGTIVSAIFWQDLDCHKGCVKCSMSSMHGKCGPPSKYDEVDSVPVSGPYINVTDSSKGKPLINISAFNASKECAGGHCG